MHTQVFQLLDLVGNFNWQCNTSVVHSSPKLPHWTNGTVQSSSLLSHPFPAGFCLKSKPVSMGKSSAAQNPRPTNQLQLVPKNPPAYSSWPPGGPTAALNTSLCGDMPSASLEPLPVHRPACVYCRCIVASASSLYLSLLPERAHLNYTRRDLPRALRGFCFASVSTETQPQCTDTGEKSFSLS